MNLSAYDKIKGSPTKSKVYLSNTYPYIITREIKKRKYYCFVTRYEPSTDETNIFLVLLDEKPEDRAVARTRQDEYGRLKFNLSAIVGKINLFNNATVVLSLETTADDGDIYKLEIESD